MPLPASSFLRQCQHLVSPVWWSFLFFVRRHSCFHEDGGHSAGRIALNTKSPDVMNREEDGGLWWRESGEHCSREVMRLGDLKIVMKICNNCWKNWERSKDKDDCWVIWGFSREEKLGILYCFLRSGSFYMGFKKCEDWPVVYLGILSGGGKIKSGNSVGEM